MMAPGFSRLAVKGYRRLRDVDLKLRPLNVLIGANGVGKTSVLDVLDLLAGSTERRLENIVSSSGGMMSLLTADNVTKDLDLQIESATSSDRYSLVYNLILTSQGYGYQIRREAMTVTIDNGDQNDNTFVLIDAEGIRVKYRRDGDLITPNRGLKQLETTLSQIDNEPDMEDFCRRLEGAANRYHVLDTSSRAPVRLPQPLGPALTPGTHGEDLLPCLYTLRETDRDRFDALEDALRVAFPTFKELTFPALSGGLLTLGWRDQNFTRPIYANELSEGTLRFLWLATLLQSPGLPSVTLIDEPEVSLHPELLRLMAELMREASDRTQLIVATHADRFVRFLNPDELLVCDQDEQGGMTTKWADETDLSAWMEDYTLDQIWSMGVVGGRG